MRLGIEASNLREGGGVTHLTALLSRAAPGAHGFHEVIVWGGRATLEQLPDRPWLIKCVQAAFDTSLLAGILWQQRGVARAARAARCDILFVPGGSYLGDFRPFVTMSRNMQPFDIEELRRHGWSAAAARLWLLRRVQIRSFRRADGLIFLTRYAKDAVMSVVKSVAGRTTIIPHGVDARFLRPPSPQIPMSEYRSERPCRILYVSIINVYKHQWYVAEAVARLRAAGLCVALDLVGPARPGPLARLRRTLDRVDPEGRFIRYLGPVPHRELPELYAAADLCLFASSCENMPNILLEGMAAGLPVACSNRGPMPEVLGDGGVYFDPEDPEDIARALRELIESEELRVRLSRRSNERARQYTWERCAADTLDFVAQVAQAAQAPLMARAAALTTADGKPGE